MSKHCVCHEENNKEEFGKLRSPENASQPITGNVILSDCIHENNSLRADAFKLRPRKYGSLKILLTKIYTTIDRIIFTS